MQRSFLIVSLLAFLSVGLVACGGNPVQGTYQHPEKSSIKMTFGSDYIKRGNTRQSVSRYEQVEGNKVKVWFKTNGGEQAMTVRYEQGGDVIYLDNPASTFAGPDEVKLVRK